MGTFTLTQTQEAKEFYLHPSAAGCATELTPIGAANNWQCVDDPTATPDDDTTYVYNDLAATKYDMYETEPSTVTPTGIINYVQVFSMAKSHEIPQAASGIYKIIITDDACSSIYKSDNKNLITSYTTHSNAWTTNPSTATDWTWADIGNLQIGNECNSPGVEYPSQQLTLRPNATGDLSEQHVYLAACPGAGNHYMCVDEETPDWFTTCLFASSNYPYTLDASDLYNITDHTTETGIIVSVTVFAWVLNNYEHVSNWARTIIKTNATTYQGDTVYLTDIDTWELISDTYTTNPFTAAAWSWAEIDALQIGSRLHAANGTIYCTQVYAIVTYTPASDNPEIRTTQQYVVVNYSEESECTLNAPEQISVSHTQNIKMLNFWSGNRAVYGLTRNKRTMVMTGSQIGESSCSDIECVCSMAEAGNEITTSGLGNTEFNDDFRIASFGWKKISTKPLRYDWILELEYA